MKFQFFILLALVGLSSQSLLGGIFDPYVKECVGNGLETIITSGNFTREALGATEFLECCDSVKCLTNEVGFSQEHAISDEARNLANVLDQKIVPCLRFIR